MEYITVDFTREPIIETVITPKEGCKLVVRSSKSSAQEEYFVDAVEVVSFGNSFFFRSTERPKAFLVPASDYEILEVREARMVLKNVGLERAIKIGGGREASPKPGREPSSDKGDLTPIESPAEEIAEPASATAESREARVDKKRDRRGRYRRRRGRDETAPKEGEAPSEASETEKIEIPAPRNNEMAEDNPSAQTLLSSILPPPPTLISETIARYKDNAMFKGAFFLRDESKTEEVEKDEGIAVPIEEPHPAPFSMTESEEEEIYRHRATSFSLEDEFFHPTPNQPPTEEENTEKKEISPFNENTNL
jgi:hypothetical protein